MCDYLRALGLSRVALQPLGVDVGRLPTRRDSTDLRARARTLAGHVRLLVYAGRFSGEKNIPRAARCLCAPRPPAITCCWSAAAKHRPPAPTTSRRMPYRRDSAAAGRRARLGRCAGARRHVRRPSASSCSRPWPAAGRWWACAPARWRSWSTSEVGVTGARASGALFAQAVRDLYDRDPWMRCGAPRRRAARASSSAAISWEPRAAAAAVPVYAVPPEREEARSGRRRLGHRQALAIRRPARRCPAGPSSS